MKKIITAILSCVFLFWFSFATDVKFGNFLTVFFEWVTLWLQGNNVNIWNSRKNVEVKYKNVDKNSALYKALQKWIHLWIFPNSNIELPVEKYVTQDMASLILKSQSDINLSYRKWAIIDNSWMKEAINQTVQDLLNESNTNENILDDVKDKLQNESIYSDTVNRDKADCDSITGCVNLIDDEYTEYFDPEDAKILYEDMEWSFAWIGAYIGTDWKWTFGITSTIAWWPAEKAGVQAWDIILQVDNHIVWKKTTSNELVSWVKWAPWTYVTIKFQRWYNTFFLKIQREQIELPNISYEIFGWRICYMDIKQFNAQTLVKYQAWIDFFQQNTCKVYMFDLRDNPGWELNTVVNMLNNFVNWWETIVEMRYSDLIQDIVADSQWPKLNKSTVMMFGNSSTASASEVFIGAIKDYVRNSILIWEKTYWKWTAQSLVEYSDWSVLKYTIAKWYTGKSKKNIDWIGFEPDAKLTDTQIDNLITALRAKK